VPTFTGLDSLIARRLEPLKGKSVAVLCNQASVTRDLEHIIDVFLKAHKEDHLNLKVIFGPQHGLFGHTQDNMIEWEGSEENRTGIPIHSLYGAAREPSDEMLEGVEVLVVDLQDVGARYYTFIWTMALCMKACERLGIQVLVLDRPNPIGGLQVEGPVLTPELSSFVGLLPLPTRHAMTLAELARHFKAAHYPDLNLETIAMTGWSRGDYFDDLDLHWIPPSPNMPTVHSAIVYPGMCLLEGTNLSEGRGTTRPFETFGAPWIDGWKLAEAVKKYELPGIRLRPIEFQPTFQKHSGEMCGGCFIHVVERRAYESVLTTFAILRECHRQAPDQFAWKEPPYEYEAEKRPIDILLGNKGLAERILSDESLIDIRQHLLAQAGAFEEQRHAAILYPTH
jgi:uncharacterized protein YbbC (DUF1343 family)